MVFKVGVMIIAGLLFTRELVELGGSKCYLVVVMTLPQFRSRPQVLGIIVISMPRRTQFVMSQPQFAIVIGILCLNLLNSKTFWEKA